MSREKKAQIIGELQEVFSRCNLGIFTDYRGLTTAEITGLRRKLEESGIEYKVVKNTLAHFAAERAGRNGLDSLFEGPVAIAFGSGDITGQAKAVVDYLRASKSTMSIKGGFLTSRLLTSVDVETLAKLPPTEVLLAQVLGAMQSPLTSLVNVLAAPMKGIMGVLQARIKQLEGE